MNYNREPMPFGAVQGDNVIVAYVGSKAIIQTEDGELHYIEDMNPEAGEIGEIVPDNSFKSIRRLTAAEQIEILNIIDRA